MEFRLAEIQAFVSDLRRARAFYGSLLGLPLKRETEQHAVFALGATSLVVSAGAQPGAVPTAYGRVPSLALVLLCADVGASLERLRAAGVTVVEEMREFPEGKLAVVADPDGNLVELIG